MQHTSTVSHTLFGCPAASRQPCPRWATDLGSWLPETPASGANRVQNTNISASETESLAAALSQVLGMPAQISAGALYTPPTKGSINIILSTQSNSLQQSEPYVAARTEAWPLAHASEGMKVSCDLQNKIV